MPIKTTLLFQHLSNADYPLSSAHRIGGWSESWYYASSTIQPAIDQLKGPTTPGISPPLLPSRAALLPSGSAILGVRLQGVDPPGPSQVLAVNFPGPANEPADVPQMALLYRVPALGSNNIRRCTLRGIPDSKVTQGEANFDLNYLVALQQYFRALGSWQFRCRDLAQPATKILAVSSAGILVAETPVTYAVGDMVRVLRTVNDKQRQVGGRFQVLSLGADNFTVTLRNWNLGLTSGGASARTS